jgi:hypothetical protein
MEVIWYNGPIFQNNFARPDDGFSRVTILRPINFRLFSVSQLPTLETILIEDKNSALLLHCEFTKFQLQPECG